MRVCLPSINWPGRKVATRRTRRGASLVEYMIVSTMYFLCVFGTIEFTWIAGTRVRLTNGCARGCRAGAVGDGLTEIRNQVRQGSGLSVGDGYIEVMYNTSEDASGTWTTATDDATTIDPATGNALGNAVPTGKPLRVRVVAYPYSMMAGQFFSFLPGVSNGQMPITTSIIMMRRE